MLKVISKIISLLIVFIVTIGFSGCSSKNTHNLILNQQSQYVKDKRIADSDIGTYKNFIGTSYTSDLDRNFREFYTDNEILSTIFKLPPPQIKYKLYKKLFILEDDKNNIYFVIKAKRKIVGSSNDKLPLYDDNYSRLYIGDFYHNRYSIYPLNKNISVENLFIDKTMKEIKPENIICKNNECTLLAKKSNYKLYVNSDKDGNIFIDWINYNKIKNNYLVAIKSYNYALVSQYKDTGVSSFLDSKDFTRAITNANTLKEVQTILEIANNESILLDNNLIVSRKNQIKFDDKFSDYSTLNDPNEIKDYLDNKSNLAGVEKTKIDTLTKHCVDLFRNQNYFNGYKGAYFFTKSENDLNNMIKLAQTVEEKEYVNKTLEYLAINKNNKSRESYFKLPKPKDNFKNNEHMDNTSLGNAILYDIAEMAQGNKTVGQFGDNIVKVLFPTSSSSQHVKFNTTLRSLAKYGKYKVKVKFTLTYNVSEDNKGLGFINTKNNYDKKYYSEAEYIVSPGGINTQMVDFGNIQLSFSSAAFGALMKTKMSSVPKGFDYEIIDVKLID